MTLALPYLYLAVAIILEVIGTSALKASDTFTRLLPSLVTVVTYAASFLFLALSLRTIPVGIAYAVWAGLGIVLIALVGWALVQAAARRAGTDRACPNHQRGHYGKCVLRVPPALAHWTALKRARSLRSAIHSMDDTDDNRQVCWSSRRKG